MRLSFFIIFPPRRADRRYGGECAMPGVYIHEVRSRDCCENVCIQGCTLLYERQGRERECVRWEMHIFPGRQEHNEIV